MCCCAGGAGKSHMARELVARLRTEGLVKHSAMLELEFIVEAGATELTEAKTIASRTPLGFYTGRRLPRAGVLAKCGQAI